jgi:hypothetical protein
MTKTVLAPMNLLPPDTAAYLHDLGRAATMARLHLKYVTVETETLTFTRGGAGSNDIGQAMNMPTGVVFGRHDKAMHDLLWAAQDTYRTTVAWYARAATLALEAVLAAGQVSARELEQRTLHRLLPNGRPARDDDWWEGANRPPIPRPDALVTGHDDLDRGVREAYEPLAAAYRAADEAASAEQDFEDREDGYVADWEASLAHDAQTRAVPLYKLLHTWADAVSFAASYGRSRARGHQPAECAGLTEAQVDQFVTAPCGRPGAHDAHQLSGGTDE